MVKPGWVKCVSSNVQDFWKMDSPVSKNLFTLSTKFEKSLINLCMVGNFMKTWMDVLILEVLLQKGGSKY